jgi:hypothetical protein
MAVLLGIQKFYNIVIYKGLMDIEVFMGPFSFPLEHWVRIGRIVEENPDLTYEFIKNILIAQQEAQADKSRLI